MVSIRIPSFLIVPAVLSISLRLGQVTPIPPEGECCCHGTIIRSKITSTARTPVGRTMFVINTSVNFTPFHFASLELRYQYERQQTNGRFIRDRSEERRVGKEGVSTGKSRWSP